MKQTSPSAARNKEPIRAVLADHLPDAGIVLTIAEGSGEHVLYFARSFPTLGWQPTDRDSDAIASIDAWRTEFPFPNLREPLLLDVTDDPWPVSDIDVVTCINMIHIAPWEATLALFAGAARLLAPASLLYLYGPYRFSGRFTSDSNAAFDASLRGRDPRWGVRDVDDVDAVAASAGFVRTHTIDMPANNHSLIFRRQ